LRLFRHARDDNDVGNRRKGYGRVFRRERASESTGYEWEWPTESRYSLQPPLARQAPVAPLVPGVGHGEALRPMRPCIPFVSPLPFGSGGTLGLADNLLQRRSRILIGFVTLSRLQVREEAGGDGRKPPDCDGHRASHLWLRVTEIRVQHIKP